MTVPKLPFFAFPRFVVQDTADRVHKSREPGYSRLARTLPSGLYPGNSTHEAASRKLLTAVHGLQAAGGLPDDLEMNIQIERTRDRAHGDFASNVAMTLAKAARAEAARIAEKIVAALPASAAGH